MIRKTSYQFDEISSYGLFSHSFFFLNSLMQSDKNADVEVEQFLEHCGRHHEKMPVP